MKKTIIINAIALAFGLLTPQFGQAQGIVYLSNLGQPSAGSQTVGSNSWLATDFHTGTNAGGYLLNSIQLALTDGSGNPSGFRVMLYANDGNPSGAFPGSSLGSLAGSLNPLAGGVYAFTDDPNIMLSAATYYFIVLAAGTAIGNGAYNWSTANVGSSSSYNPSGGWINGGPVMYSNNGLSWGSVSGAFPQYAIDATATPEPGVLSLFGLGSLGFLWQRRK